MSAVFFVIVAVHADGGNDFSNTLLRVQAEEPAGRIIFVNQIYLCRGSFCILNQLLQVGNCANTTLCKHNTLQT